MFTRLGLPMNPIMATLAFVLQKTKTLSIALHLRKCRPRLPVYIVIQSLKDISYNQIFLQRSTRNFEIRRRVSVLKNDEIQKEHTHTSLSLSLLVDTRMYFDFPERICMHQSPSLFLSIQICKNELDADQTRMEFNKECFVILKI